MDEICRLELELEEISLEIIESRKRNDDLKRKLSLLNRTPPETPIDDERIHFNDSSVYDEIARRGINLRFLPHTNIVEARYGSHVELLLNATTRSIPYVDAYILENKFHTKQLLKENGYSVSEGMAFDSNDINAAQSFVREELGYPIVIKPTGGAGGKYVFCNIQTDSEFRRAYSALSRVTFAPILVERFIAGVDDYRFFIINGKVISIVKRTPPVIVGDGISTIQQLVDAENERRMNPRTNCLCSIVIDDFDSERCFQMQCIGRNSILKKGEAIQCRFNANVSMGGECETVKDIVHPSYSDIAVSILKLFSNLPVLVVDLLIRDCTQEACDGNYWVCECCCINPGLSLHTHPSKGKGDDIITPLVDLLFPETASKQ